MAIRGGWRPSLLVGSETFQFNTYFCLRKWRRPGIKDHFVSFLCISENLSILSWYLGQFRIMAILFFGISTY